MPISPAPPNGRNSSSSAVGLWESVAGDAGVLADVLAGDFNILNRHGPRRRPIDNFLFCNGCKLVDPPPSRRMMNIKLPASSILVPPIDLDQATHRDLRVQMV